MGTPSCSSSRPRVCPIHNHRYPRLTSFQRPVIWCNCMWSEKQTPTQTLFFGGCNLSDHISQDSDHSDHKILSKTQPTHCVISVWDARPPWSDLIFLNTVIRGGIKPNGGSFSKLTAANNLCMFPPVLHNVYTPCFSFYPQTIASRTTFKFILRTGYPTRGRALGWWPDLHQPSLLPNP